MKIVTDSAANLTSEKIAALGVEVVPFKVTFNHQTYRDGVDIDPEALYRLYQQHPNEYPSTSQPPAGEYAALYDQCEDEQVLSIHLSSGLSGSYASAVAGAEMSHKQVTVVDSKTIGPALGWMVEVAAHGARQGWPLERILAAIQRARENTFTTVSFSDVKYLVNSGRVSHLRGIIASVLKIKPIIGVNDQDGRFSSLGQAISMNKVVQKMGDLLHERFGSHPIRLQLMHGSNLPGVERLREAVTGVMNCFEDQLVAVTAVLGAHAGPTVIGLAAMPVSVQSELLES